MADTPESLVYRGREGTGAAQIFGREGNPMRAFRERKADVENRRRLQAEQERLQREKRDKDLWELVNVNPDKAFEPFDEQVKQAAEAHRREVVNRVERTGGNVTPDIKLFAKNGWDKIGTLAAKSQYIKNVVADTQKAIQDNPFLNYDYYFPKVNDLYLNPDGTARPLDQINVDAIRDIYVKDPMGFNEAKYHKSFMDGLNENMSNFVRQRATNNGILTEDVESKWKGNTYIPDPNSSIGVKVDETGKPLLNITPDLVNSYTNSDSAQRFYQATADKLGIPIQDVVANTIKANGGGGLQTNIRPSFSRNQSWYWDQFGSGLKPADVPVANKLWENVGHEVNAFINTDGSRRKDASPEARAAVGHMIGNKSGGGTVKEVEFIPRTNRPGKTTVFGKSIDNSPNDRMVRKIMMSNGRTKIEEIDLTDEGAGSALWTLHTAGGYFGKKRDISFDQAAQDLNFDPTTLYRRREDLGINQEKEQANINSWAAGDNFKAMEGKTYEGSTIKSVEPIRERTLRHPIDGVFKGYKVTLSNGETKEISKDDYDGFSDIYQSDTSVKLPTKLKESYQFNGKKYSLKDLREKYGYTDEQIQEAIDEGNLQ